MSDYDRIDYTRSGQRRWAGWLLVVGIAFVAGMLSMGWILTRWDTAAPYLSWMRPPPPGAATPAQPNGLLAPTETTPATVDHRVDNLENRIEHIAQRANAAAGNADRAEGLLVAFAARRAVDRGLELGYIESLLRDRFGRTQPQAVATILGAARDPVTLDELRADLDTLSPDLSGAATNASWWDTMRRELASAIVVRRAELPRATPDDRLTRARHDLATDHVDRALAEVARLPARDRAAQWMSKARRYIAAHNALDLIETSALLMPINPVTHDPAIRPADHPDAE